jgi:hypothetical protein
LAKWSRRVEGNVDQLRPSFAVLKPIRDYAKSERLDSGLSFR